MKSDIDAVLCVVAHRLPEADVPCIMIGGHAVNHYGVIRATQDIDFMIATSAADTVKRIMLAAGFTNMALHETVMFFNQPNSPLRVDFLKVDSGTMQKLMAKARKIRYAGTTEVWVPRLQDLLSMKIFALCSGSLKRRDRDFFDVVNLVIENAVDVDQELKPIVDAYGNEECFEALKKHIQELSDAEVSGH